MQQTLCNNPQDVIAAFELTVLIKTEFPQPSLKDNGHSKSPQRQSLHAISAVCVHCKTHNYTEDQFQKKACKLPQLSSPATSTTSALSSALTTHNSTSTLLHQTPIPTPAAEQQDSIGDEEEYNKYFKSQWALNSITITNDMPGPNDPI